MPARPQLGRRQLRDRDNSGRPQPPWRRPRAPFEDMRPALHPAVHEHVDPITYGVDDFGQLVERCPRAVKLSAAMVRNNDAGTTDLGGVFGVGWGHDALQAELTVPNADHLTHIVPVHGGGRAFP